MRKIKNWHNILVEKLTGRNNSEGPGLDWNWILGK
jgi:hypothetical protein